MITCHVLSYSYGVCCKKDALTLDMREYEKRWIDSQMIYTF